MTGAPTIRDDEPLAVAAMEAIRSGDVSRLRALLTEPYGRTSPTPIATRSRWAFWYACHGGQLSGLGAVSR